MGHPAREQVPASLPVLGDEVEVIARHVKPLSVIWKAEAHEAAPSVAQFEGWLVLHHLDEGRVRLALSWHAARLDVVEKAVYPNGVAHVRVADDAVQVGAEVFVAHRADERPAQVGLEEGDHGERGPQPPVDLVGPPVRLHLVEVAMECDHLAVQRLKRTEAEIAASLKFRKAYVTLVVAAQQGVYCRGLEEGVVRILDPPNVPLSQVLNVQRTDQSGVNRHRISLL